MERRFLLALCLMLGLTAPASVFAQEGGAGVVIMKFEQFDANPDVVAALAEQLAASIDAHEQMAVKPAAEMTIKDLALTAGCGSPDAECLGKLKEFVDGDRVVFGTVQGSGNVHMFSLKMFDFAEGRFIAEVTEETVEGDPATVVSVVPAVVEGFLYGDVGTVVVEVSGADQPDLLFDGLKVGLAPTTLENLPLGQHVVTVRTADGQEQSETVVLRHNEPSSVSFSFAAVASQGDGGGGPSIVPGIVVLGLGVAGIAVGAFSSLQVNEALADNERLGAEGFVDPERGAFTSSQAHEDAKAANLDPEAIDRRGKTFTIVQFVGYGVGAVGVGLGIYLIARALGSDEKESAALPFDFGVSPSRDGVAGWVGTRF